MFDFIVVGAGFSGAVIAERIASVLNRKVLVIERRKHLGGNCYDYRHGTGIIVHKYGPHLFHTDYKEVWEYLSNFTEWRIYHHRVLAFVDGQKIPLPFNLNSLHMLFPESLAVKIEEKLVSTYGFNAKVPILPLRKTSDPDLQILAEFVYKKIFLNYTVKQWGVAPDEIDEEVTARVPVFVGRDNRYFHDKYQGVPEAGYTSLFERMLSHPNIKLMLNTDAKEVMNWLFAILILQWKKLLVVVPIMSTLKGRMLWQVICLRILK